MTERERYRTQASYFSSVMRNYEKAVETNTVLVQKYPADGMAHNNLAVAHFNLLNFEKAREQGQAAVELYPKNRAVPLQLRALCDVSGRFRGR